MTGTLKVYDGSNWNKINPVVSTKDTIVKGYSVGDSVNLITVSVTGMFFLVVPWDGKITRWDIQTGDNTSRTISTIIKKNGSDIGQAINLSSASTASGTGLSISVTAADVLAGWVTSNSDATKVVVQLLMEKT